MRKSLLLLMVVALAAGCKYTDDRFGYGEGGMGEDGVELDPVDDYWIVDPDFGAAIMLYPVNRILDTLDLASLNVGIGLDLQANVHATRALQLGLGGATTARLGFNTGREVGLYRQTGVEWTFLALTNEYFVKKNLASWQSVSETLYKVNGVSQPGAKVYRETRDYWALGVHVPLGLASVEAEVHPVEIPDLVLGFIGIDMSSDDLRIKSGHDPME